MTSALARRHKVGLASFDETLAEDYTSEPGLVNLIRA
jgi:hypothetical protein